jgi:hypothetical protein
MEEIERSHHWQPLTLELSIAWPWYLGNSADLFSLSGLVPQVNVRGSVYAS